MKILHFWFNFLIFLEIHIFYCFRSIHEDSGYNTPTITGETSSPSYPAPPISFSSTSSSSYPPSSLTFSTPNSSPSHPSPVYCTPKSYSSLPFSDNYSNNNNTHRSLPVHQPTSTLPHPPSTTSTPQSTSKTPQAPSTQASLDTRVSIPKNEGSIRPEKARVSSTGTLQRVKRVYL